jgi:hypothetical protein
MKISESCEDDFEDLIVRNGPHLFGSHPPLFRQEGKNLLAIQQAQGLGGSSAKSDPVKMPVVQIDLEQVTPTVPEALEPM